MNIIKVILSVFKKFAKNEDNSQIAKTIEGGEFVSEVEFFQTPGIVSGLTPSDQIVVSKIDGGGYRVGIASFNYKIGIEATSGQTKIYSSDNTGNTKQAEIILNSDGKIKLSNNSQSIKTLIDELIDELINFKTFGSPSNHTTDPGTITNLNSIKTKIGQILY